MGTRDEYVASLKQAFVTLGDKTLYPLAVSEFPFLGIPIVNIATHHFIKWLLSALAQGGEMTVFFAYIDVRVNQQGVEFVDAAIANRYAQMAGTEQEKKDAEEALRIAFNRFAVLTS